MAVFAYSLDVNVPVNNPLEFLQTTETTTSEREILNFAWNLPIQSVKERTEFLRQYALDNDLPFVVFGD